jgi:hypothetical protein
MRGWARVTTACLSVAVLAGAAPVLAQTTPPPAPHFPWAAADPAPSVAGVSLGQSKDAVIAALGPPGPAAPGETVPAGQFVLNYPARGVSVAGSAAQGVFSVTLLRPEAGAVGAMHVGDNLPAMLTRWGRPRTVNGPYGIYGNDRFIAIVQFDPATMIIARLGIAAKTAP